MNLHEYQAKKLFKQFGMPVSPSYVAKTVDEAVAGGVEPAPALGPGGVRRFGRLEARVVHEVRLGRGPGGGDQETDHECGPVHVWGPPLGPARGGGAVPESGYILNWTAVPGNVNPNLIADPQIAPGRMNESSGRSPETLIP